MRDPRQIPVSDDTTVQIAEYVCGLLRPEEHAQVHVLLSRDDQALAQALAWEEALLALVDALPRAQPAAALRERLQRTLGIGPPPAFQPPAQLLRRPSVEPGAAPVPPAWNAEAPRSVPSAPSAPPVPAHPGLDSGADAAATTENEAVTPPPAPATPMPASPVPSRAAAQAPRPAAQRQEPSPPVPPPAPSVTPGADKTPDPASATALADATMQAALGESNARQRRLVRKLWFWRLIGLCAASTAIVGFMMPGEPPPPPVQIVKVAPTRAAILQAPGSTSTPGWTATLGPEGNLTMQPLVHTEVPAGSQALLWTRSEQIPEPRLLGRIDPNRPVQVPATQLGALADDQLLEITLETDADAANAAPNGPVLFIGQMTVFGSEGAVAAPAAGEPAAMGANAAGGPITR